MCVRVCVCLWFVRKITLQRKIDQNNFDPLPIWWKKRLLAHSVMFLDRCSSDNQAWIGKWLKIIASNPISLMIPLQHVFSVDFLHLFSLTVLLCLTSIYFCLCINVANEQTGKRNYHITHLGKWILGSSSQYSLHKNICMCSESSSIEKLGPKHRNLWEKGKWAAENYLESMPVGEVCDGGMRGIQSRDRHHIIIYIHYSGI